MSLTQQRDAFDLPEGIVYLNCAAQSPSLKSSHKAGQTGLMRKHHPWDPERNNLGPEMERSRELFGNLIGAKADNIALVGSTSYGAAVAANAITLSEGQNVVMIEGQFPSNYYAWQNLADKSGAIVRTITRPEGSDWASAIIDAIDENTGLVALANCFWSDGSLVDLDRIAPKVHEVGAAFFIDATQSVGVKALDVAALNPDYVMCSAYKWLLSPDAAGFLYVADRRMDAAPIEMNHAARTGGPPMELSTDYARDYAVGARRYDYGAADNMVHQPMVVKALEQILEWGQDNISAYIADLVDYTAELATERGYQVPPKANRIGHFIGLQPSGDCDIDLAPSLAKQDIYISLRGARIRVSPYVFNDRKDIETLFEALDKT